MYLPCFEKICISLPPIFVGTNKKDDLLEEPEEEYQRSS